MILSELIQAIEPLQVIGKTDVNVHAIQFDSRKVEAGDLFVAQAGTAVDGHTFIPSCVEKGASVIVLDNSQYLADTKDGVCWRISGTDVRARNSHWSVSPVPTAKRLSPRCCMRWSALWDTKPD